MSQLFKWRRYKAHIALSPEYFHKEQGSWSSQRGSVEMNLTSLLRTQVGFLTSLSGLKFQRCCELWCRLQMRLRSRVAVALT